MAASLYKDAKDLLQKGRPAEALAKANSALDKFKEHKENNDGLRTQVAELVFEVYLSTGSPMEAAQTVEDELSYCRGLGDKSGLVSMLTKGMEVFLAGGKGDEALLLALEARPIAQTVGDTRRTCALLRQMVEANLMEGNDKAALTLANEMLGDAKDGGDGEMQALAWIALSEVHAAAGDDAEALAAAKKSLPLYRKEKGCEKGQATALSAIAAIQLKLAKVNEALMMAKEARTRAKEAGDLVLLGHALELIVQAQTAVGNPKGALYTASDDLDFCRKQGDQRAEAQILRAVITAHGACGNNKEGAALGQQGLELYRSMGDQRGEADLMIVLSKLHAKNGQNKVALKMAQDALALFRAAGSKAGVVRSEDAISDVYVNMGTPGKAPRRKAALEALEEIASAVQAKDADAFQAANLKASKFDRLFKESDHQMALAPAMDEDPEGTSKFLKQNGWGALTQSSGAEGGLGGNMQKMGKVYDHQTLYAWYRTAGGMGFGPQFRGVHPIKTGTAGVDATGLSSVQLPETEDWELRMSFRPGILDGGLQTGAACSFH